MSSFNFEFNGQKFEIKAPTGTTFEQAKAVFEQQTASGGLTGFRVGDVLSPATQAAGGLAAAQSQLTQGLASITGKLPTGVNLNSLTSSIGALGQGAASQVAGALQGGAAAFNSLTTGASGATAAISSGLSGVTAGLSGVTAKLGSGFSLPQPAALSGVLTGAAAQADSIASKTVGTLSGLVQGTTNLGINVADFAKQGPALSGLGNMKLPDVTGTLAQASKLVGQGADKISNALGAGKFGLDASQLERAGLVKPGTAAAFLAGGDNDLVNVLKSPTVWTGKEGVKSLDGLLKNSGLQDKVQQGLMKTGLNDLKSLGVPTDKLTPQALSGLATNAAKSVPNTVDWAKNVPGLPADIKGKFDAAAVGGAFAVNLAQNKVDAPVLQETKPVAATETVNTATVDAAGQRVVGNDKVPTVSSSADAPFADAKIKIKASLDLSQQTAEAINAIEPTITEYEKAASITQSQWETLNAEWQTIRATFNARAPGLTDASRAAVEALPSGQRKNNYIEILNSARRTQTALVELAKITKKRIADLANKIVTSGEQTA